MVGRIWKLGKERGASTDLAHTPISWIL